MPKLYQHLNAHERDVLAVLRSNGQSLRQIAQVLKRDPSSLCRELSRNAPPIRTGYYLSHKAQTRSEVRNSISHRRRRLKSELIRRYVENRILCGWSPELIAGRLKLQYPEYSISHEAIYQWIYEDAWHLIPSLVRAHRKRKNRGYSRKHKKTHIPERVSIRKRPLHVLKRLQIGHWETDTVISRKSKAAIQVTVERKARYTKLAKLTKKGSRQMSIALVYRLGRIPSSLRLSITYDNGSENTEHLRTNRLLGTRSYFCEPFHSWERGTVENTIGLVRRFFPKKTDFATISKSRIRSVERWLNNRPRKCLGFKTPAEVFKSAGVALTG